MAFTHYRDPETGYYDPDEWTNARHEEAMEAQYRTEIEASHSPQCETDLEQATRQVGDMRDMTEAELDRVEDRRYLNGDYDAEMERPGHWQPTSFGMELSTASMLRARFGKRVA